MENEPSSTATIADMALASSATLVETVLERHRIRNDLGGWVTMLTLQSETHLARDEIIPALRELMAKARLESIPGNGFANHRYRLVAQSGGPKASTDKAPVRAKRQKAAAIGGSSETEAGEPAVSVKASAAQKSPAAAKRAAASPAGKPGEARATAKKPTADKKK